MVTVKSPAPLLAVLVIGLIAATPATRPAADTDRSKLQAVGKHPPATSPAEPEFVEVLTQLADDRTAIKTAGIGKSLDLSDDQHEKFIAEIHAGAEAERQVEKNHAAEKPAIVAHAKRVSEAVKAAGGNANPAQILKELQANESYYRDLAAVTHAHRLALAAILTPEQRIAAGLDPAPK